MRNMQTHPCDLDRLMDMLRSAESLSPAVVADLVAGACTRMPLLNRAGKTAAHISELTRASAWTDLALAIVATELPGWTLRRVAYDDGVWHCSLSKNIGLPHELDDTADASHENLALALLSAFVVARAHGSERASDVRARAHSPPAKGVALCCDNFA